MPPQLRYEFYLPTYYNNDANPEEFGKPIQPSKYRVTKNKIIKKFGSLSIHPGSIQGVWTDSNTNKRYYDVCYKWEICVDIKGDNISYFEELKEYLKFEFKQHEIFMVHFEVNRV